MENNDELHNFPVSGGTGTGSETGLTMLAETPYLPIFLEIS